MISVAVRRHVRYGLSYRDVGELLRECGIMVNHVTVYRCEQHFTAQFIEAARPCRRLPGDRWSVDDTCVKISEGTVAFVRTCPAGTTKSPATNQSTPFTRRL
jgi:IS6 family transposase